MNNDKKIVNVHIEKTAGRSTRQIFLSQFGADRVMTYDPVFDAVIRASNRLVATERDSQEKIKVKTKNRLLFPFIKLGFLAVKSIERDRFVKPELMPLDFDVLTGHYDGQRFQDILSPERETYTSVIRHPLDRMWSHYRHWKRTQGIARFRVMPPYDPNVTFEQFALLPELQNYQTNALGIDPSRYSLLGDANHLSEYLEELGLIEGSGEVPHKNKGDWPLVNDFDTTFISAFENYHYLDYELYADTQTRWSPASEAV